MKYTYSYCERRYFRAVHIFAKFAFLKYLRKNVHLENYFYDSLNSQLQKTRILIHAKIPIRSQYLVN